MCGFLLWLVFWIQVWWEIFRPCDQCDVLISSCYFTKWHFLKLLIFWQEYEPPMMKDWDLLQISIWNHCLCADGIFSYLVPEAVSHRFVVWKLNLSLNLPLNQHKLNFRIYWNICSKSFADMFDKYDVFLLKIDLWRFSNSFLWLCPPDKVWSDKNLNWFGLETNRFNI